MGTCVCGDPIGLMPRACRLEDHALLWPPVRINADGSEHVCRVKKRTWRVWHVEPVPAEVQAARANERAAAETTAAVAQTAQAVERLADVLTDEAAARQDYFRQRAGAGRPAPRPEGRQGLSAPAQGAGTTPPAATHVEPEGSLADELFQGDVAL